MTIQTVHRTRAHTKTRILKDTRRRFRLAAARLGRLLPLSLRFLIMAVVVVALAMLVLGSWIGHYLQTSISQGIAVSWASTIDSLVTNRFTELPDEGPISPSDRATFDMMFEVGSAADSTRLLHIRVWRWDGWLLYESAGSLIDPISPEDFRAAAERGEVTSRVMPIPLEAVGPIERHALTALRIYTPLHRSGSDAVFGVAALYYSAQSLLDIQFQAQLNVWVVAGPAAPSPGSARGWRATSWPRGGWPKKCTRCTRPRNGCDSMPPPPMKACSPRSARTSTTARSSC